MVIFGSGAPIESDVNLILQIVILGFLLFGLWKASKRSFLNHGVIMTIVVILNAISIIWRMIPSFIGTSLGGFLGLDLFSAVIMIHIVIGVIAETAGIYFVIRWRFSKKTEKCFGLKKPMQFVLALYIISFLFGVAVYLFY